MKKRTMIGVASLILAIGGTALGVSQRNQVFSNVTCLVNGLDSYRNMHKITLNLIPGAYANIRVGKINNQEYWFYAIEKRYKNPKGNEVPGVSVAIFRTYNRAPVTRVTGSVFWEHTFNYLDFRALPLEPVKLLHLKCQLNRARRW